MVWIDLGDLFAPLKAQTTVTAATVGAVVGGVAGAIVGGIAGAAGGTLVEPGGGTIVGGGLGGAEGAKDGAALGALIGATLGVIYSEATNTNPYAGPVSAPVTVVDPKGNAVPVKPGEQIQGSKDGRWAQVKDANGQPTGTRIDGGHPASSHSDPRAQVPHAHVPGVKNADGTPWLPVNQ